jgi:hypothetical protein
MTLIDDIIVTDLDGTNRYDENTDYEIDFINDRIRRLPGGSIPDSGDIRVFYGKEILSAIINQLESTQTALLPRVKAKIVKLTSPDQSPDEGSDISDEITSCKIDLSLSGPGRFTLHFADAAPYLDFDPNDDIFIHISAGIATDDAFIFQPVFLGLVEERCITSDDEFHHLEITGRDLSGLLDFPKSSASGLTFNPSYKRQVFLNGILISDEWRAEQLLSGDALSINDIVEISYERVFPMCHDAIRAILNEAGWNPDAISINMIDFPLTGFDARGMSPLDALTDLASRVGAAIRAEGNTIVIGSKEDASSLRTSWTYPASVILSLNENELDEQEYNAVQIFGHSETGLAPTRANLLPPIDPSMPGYARIFEKEGTLVPEEPVRTHEPPQPFEMKFRLPVGTFDPHSLLVSGARLKETPVQIGDENEITLLVDWLFEDTAGEPPYIIDENGDKRFFLRGVVFDAVPGPGNDYKPIAHAKVERERTDIPGESSEQTCDDAGRYCFENVSQGIYKLIASHPDYMDNYEDTDPSNDIERDLFEEETDYDAAIEDGRYLKYETDYHVIVWAKPSTEAWGLTEHVISQVRLEVRAISSQTNGELKYAAPIRDENITTETLAAEIGRIIIGASSDTRHPREISLPLNPFLRPGESIIISGNEIDQQDGSKIAVDRLVHSLNPGDAEFTTTAYTGEYNPSVMCRKHLKDDPLDRINAVIVGITRDSRGVERCDAAASGTVFRNLARSAAVPTVKVGDAVLIAKPSRNATHYLIVARVADIFGPERIVYV